jgi:hypothetical protein
MYLFAWSKVLTLDVDALVIIDIVLPAVLGPATNQRLVGE